MYDTIVVGGGIAGLYSCFRLLQKNPGERIALLEKGGRLGGRIKTMHLEDGTWYDAGAARIARSHHRVLSLMKELKVSVEELSYERREKMRDDPLAPLFLGEAPETLRMVSTGTLVKNYDKDPETVFAWWGYNGNMRLKNALDFSRTYREDYLASKYYSARDGLGSLIEALHTALEGKIEIVMDFPVHAIRGKAGSGFVLRGEHSEMKCRRVILALPPAALFSLEGVLVPFRDLFETVASNNYLRIYAKFDAANSKKLGRKKKNLGKPLNFLLPTLFEGLYQISYTDGEDASYLLENLLAGTLDPILKAGLGGGLEWEWIDFHYWKRGTHSWKIGCASDDFYGRLLEPIPGISVCGEGFSHHQGWIEGALETVDDMLLVPKKQPRKTHRRKAQKSSNYVIFDGKRYDVTHMLNRHPGGKSVLRRFLQKDISEVFRHVGHSETAEQLLRSMPLVD